MILTWINSLLTWFQVISTYLILRLKSTVMKALMLSTVLSFLFWISVFMYSSFHRMYIPSNVHTKQVHFGYKVDCESISRLCSFPSANISLLESDQKHLLMLGQGYTIILYLEMPESPLNQQLGMFQVRLELYGGKGIAASQVRSTMIRFKSSLLQTIETVTNSPLYLLGMREQKQDLAIVLLDHFTDDVHNPIAGGKIDVLSRNIEIYSAVLQIHAKMTGLRYLVFEYPILSAFFGITSNLSFLIAVTLVAWYKLKKLYAPEEKPIQTLEERRRALRVTLHRERSINPPEEQTPLLLEDDKSSIVLKKMSTSSVRRPARDQTMGSPPENITAGQSSGQGPSDHVDESMVTATLASVDQADNPLIMDSGMEIRQRKPGLDISQVHS